MENHSLNRQITHKWSIFRSYFDPEANTWSWEPQHQAGGHEVSLEGFVVAIIASTELSCAMVGWLGWLGWVG